MIYDPSHRTSTPSSAFDVGRMLLRSVRKRWCLPPLPVIAVAVSGSSPCSVSHCLSVARPSFVSLTSKSSTSSPPDGAPHVIPIFEFGCCDQWIITCSGLSVQSFRPCGVAGLLSLSRHGKTAKPARTYSSAALPKAERFDSSITPCISPPKSRICAAPCPAYGRTRSARRGSLPSVR